MNNVQVALDKNTEGTQSLNYSQQEKNTFIFAPKDFSSNEGTLRL